MSAVSKLNKNYLSLTFLLMLLGWGSCVLCSLRGISLSDHKWLYVPYLLGGLSPTIASYCALKRSRSVAGVKAWLKNIFDFRHPVFSYLMVVVMAILFLIPQCVICGYESGAPIYAIIVLVPVMLVGGGLEEAGWRYILQPELEKKYSFAISTIAVSLIWWLWHLPLFFIQGVGQYGKNFFAFGISVLGVSFALAGIRKNTGSVWLCVLFHCLVNALGAIYIIQDHIWGDVVTAAILILCACVLVKMNDRIKSCHLCPRHK